MVMKIRRRTRMLAALGATLLGALQGTQAQAATSTDTGAGAGVMSFTPSASVDCPIFTFSGTAVIAVHGPAGEYAGPITMQGSAPWCITPPIGQPNAQLVVTGSPEFGDFGCGTPASPMIGFWSDPFDVIEVEGSCHVAGAVVPGTSVFTFLSGSATGIPDNVAMSGWTDAGVVLWSAS